MGADEAFGLGGLIGYAHSVSVREPTTERAGQGEDGEADNRQQQGSGGDRPGGGSAVLAPREADRVRRGDQER